MDELKEIERKIVTTSSMSDLRALFKKMQDDAKITADQADAMLIVSKRDGIVSAARSIDYEPEQTCGYDNPDAIIAFDGERYFFAGMADEIVRSGK